MAARYWVKEQFPELEPLWSKRGNAANGDRERIQDLYSRPILANHAGVLASVHLHTNASSNPERSGLQVYYQEGTPEAELFGKRMLCQLWRRIGLRYPEHKVPVIPLPGDYAELRGSKTPAVIVELGFHTNADDAQTLQLPGFRKVVAEAIDKGFTYQVADMPCEPFNVTDFKYELSNGSATVSFSYDEHFEENKLLELRLQVKQDGVCKETLIDSRIDNVGYEGIRPKPGTVLESGYCSSQFTDEPVVINVLSEDELLWSKKMRLTCPDVYPVEYCGCSFCPSEDFFIDSGE
jgi:hypothetical protein